MLSFSVVYAHMSGAASSDFSDLGVSGKKAHNKQEGINVGLTKGKVNSKVTRP